MVASKSTTASLRSARTTAFHHNKHRCVGEIATPWIHATKVFLPASARPAAKDSLSRATSVSQKKASAWRLTCRLLMWCSAVTMPVPTIPVRCPSVPPGRMPRSVRPRLAAPAGAVASAVRRSHRTPRPPPGSGNITITRLFSNCWSKRCPCAESSKSPTSTPRPSTTASTSSIASAKNLPPTASTPCPTSPSGDCTSAWTDRTTL